jgi:archaetidylinositol phosphate synthase
MAESKLLRFNEGLLRPIERPVLAWLAARMPTFITPDMLTLVGFLGAILAFIGYYYASSSLAMLWIASLGLFINWFGDSLDGTIARHRKIERPRYGFFIDHTADVFEQFLIALGMGLSGLIRFELAIIALIVYLMLSLLTFARAQLLNTLQISYAGFGPTEVRAALILMNVAMIFFPPQSFSMLGVVTTYPNLLSLTWSTLGSTVLLLQVFMTFRQLRNASHSNDPRTR